MILTPTSIKTKIIDNKFVLLILIILSLLYFFNRHFLRPYIYRSFDNSILIFFFGVFPNFLGPIIFYLFGKHILNLKTIYITKYIIIYAIFHESINFFLDNIPFDIYDVLTTIITMVLIICIEKISK